MSSHANSLLKTMTFRNLGPSRGGRVVAVAGDPSNPAVFYFGAVCGGVFKTTDAGTTWLPVSDGQLKTSSVGALAVSASDPNVIYAGMGEATIRTDVSYGDGVYKSTDAGKTWKHMGLADSKHIGKIVIHPKNPDIAYVAALGHIFGEKGSQSEERGIFRTQDGGKTWQRVLFKSLNAGGIDIALDERNPDVLYASIWQVYRNFWFLDSGGADSGLWMSKDGGDSWVDISKNKGLEKCGLLGKIGVATSPAQPGRVYALIEAKDKPGLFRSDDFGETWQLTTDFGELRRRPWYYMHITADPLEADTVYVNNLGFWKSTDAGKTFSQIPTPHGDNHALWIDPKNNKRMVQGNDGGANVSFNGGETFSTIFNQLTGQYYHMDADNQFPYRVYATQQDNSSISVPSDTIPGGVSWGDCYVAGTGESGHIAVKPDDPNIVVVGAVGSSPGGLGALQKYDHRTGQIQLINVWPQPYGAVDASTFKYRFPWTYPILFSPHDPNTLYVCGNIAWRSKDLGHSWEQISPDLTRNDPDKLKASGGSITLDTSGAEFYCNIYTFRESPHQKNVFMAGTDDGLVHRSLDGGKTWKDITPKALPEWSFVRYLEPSAHDAKTWYLCATRYKLDDTKPYLLRTKDMGETWEAITNGIPDWEYTRVLRADPIRKGLLFCGTETGLYVSFDDGANWERWNAKTSSGGHMPAMPIYDMMIKGDDLILASHGRGFWVMDDLSALRESLGGKAKDGAYLFSPAKSYRLNPDLTAAWYAGEGKSYSLGGGAGVISTARKDENGWLVRHFHDAGAGREKGAIIYYALPDGAEAGKATLAVLDARGKVVREFKPKPADYDTWDEKKKSLNPGPFLPVKPGMNRMVWDLKHTGSAPVAGNKTATESFSGPLVAPGKYKLRLSVGDKTLTAPCEVLADPRVTATPADLRAQEKFLLELRDKVSDAHKAVNKLRDTRDQASAWKKRLDAAGDKPGAKEVAAACDALIKKLDAVEDELILPGEQKDSYGLISRTRLNAAIGELISIANSADSKPTVNAQKLFAEHAAAVDAQVTALDKTMKKDLAALNDMIAEVGLHAIG